MLNMNPIYQSMGNNQIKQRLNQLKQAYKGQDPNQIIQNLLNSGKVSQETYNNAVQKAEQIKNLIGY